MAFQAENSYFTVSDLLALLIAFDRVSEVGNLVKLIDTIISRLPDAAKNSDTDMLKLFQLLNKRGLLGFEKYEHLSFFVHDHVAMKFDLMKIDDYLAFCDFMHEIGLWYWNQDVVAQAEAHFSQNYV